MFQGSFKRHAKVALPSYIILLAILIPALIISSDFSSASNISNVISQVAPIAIVAIGQTLVIMMAGIDLSNGSIVSLSTIILAKLSYDSTGGLVVALLLCFAMGALVGLINGVGIMRLNVPPMIMTLATGAIVKGIALYIQPSSGGMINMPFTKFMTTKFEPLNVMAIIIIILYLLFIFLLATTKWGRNIYAVGGDMVNAAKNGISVVKTQIITYIVAGLMAVMGGIMLAARTFSGSPVVGDSFTMDTITAVIVGGTSISGGIGGVIGTLGGVFLVSMLNNIMNMLEIFPYYQYVVKGLILVVALLIQQVKWNKIQTLMMPVKTIQSEGEKRS